MNNKKILITGGTGFIGFHLAKKCLKLNWSVTSLSTKKPKINRRLSKVKYLISDISNKKKLLKSIKPNFYDYVVNLAGYVDHSNKKKTMESHFKGCKNLSLLFLNSKIEKFIQIGSSIEYGKKKSPQIESKINNYLEALKTDWESLPQYFVTSSEKRLGGAPLLEHIQQINKSIEKL